jgi:hypothetical protein
MRCVEAKVERSEVVVEGVKEVKGMEGVRGWGVAQRNLKGSEVMRWRSVETVGGLLGRLARPGIAMLTGRTPLR